MSALNHLISITNLLYHRKHVSIKTITELCSISERTAFRYIDAISEANIPVYYDKTSKGYRLNHYADLSLDELNINEVIMVVVALKYLSLQMRNYYKESIENLLTKITSTRDFALEGILRMINAKLKSNVDDKQLNELVTSALIQAAVQAKKRLNIKFNNDSLEAETQFKKPRLKFKKRWGIIENEQEPHSTIPLKKISGVHIGP